MQHKYFDPADPRDRLGKKRYSRKRTIGTRLARSLHCLIIALAAAMPCAALSQQTPLNTNALLGHYSREGNNDSPTRTINNNIYMKLFENNWIATLYVPHPYAESVQPDTITRVLEQAKSETSTSAYIRGKFGLLEQNATVHIEKFGFVEDRIIYECGSLAPCTIKLHDGFLELIKPGVINEHIIKYHHVKVD
ncbi:MAG: hypothetical protein WBM41_18425 [Arenicellales bacterium]